MTKEKMIQMELRKADLAADDGEMTVSGYAAVFDQPAVMWHDPYSGIDYKESVGAHAFDKADMSNVVLRYNHNDSCEILARTSNGTLTLEVDEKGLRIQAKLANTTLGRDVYELIKRKDITQMSFAFTVAPDGDVYDNKTYTRYINNIDRVFDVSAVDLPAYEGTSIEAVARGVRSAAREYQEMADTRRRIALLTMN